MNKQYMSGDKTVKGLHDDDKLNNHSHVALLFKEQKQKKKRMKF